jgi:hypothetical protein
MRRGRPRHSTGSPPALRASRAARRSSSVASSSCEAALQHKLDAIADGLADLMEYHLDHDDVDLHQDVEELKEAVGLPQVS